MIVTASVIFAVISHKDNSDFTSLVRRIDLSIEERDISSLDDLFERAMDLTTDNYSVYQLIKRAIKTSEITGRYDLFLRISEFAAKTFSGNEDMQAYYVMALIKNREYKKASENASLYLKSREYRSLLAQAVILGEEDSSSGQDLVKLVKAREDSYFLEYLGELLDSQTLSYNAALLWAGEGEYLKAYHLVKYFEGEEYEEAAALLAHDAQRRGEALLRLLELPRTPGEKTYNTVLTGDLFFMDNNPERARFYYEKSIQEDPLFSHVPYVNLASLLFEQGQRRRAWSVLKGGIENFRQRILELIEEAKELKVSLDGESDGDARALIERRLQTNRVQNSSYQLMYRKLVLLYYDSIIDSDKSEAVYAVNGYIDLFDEDVKVQLLSFKNSEESILPEKYRARLWDLFNRDMENREVIEYLIWYLAGTYDYQSALLVAERAENRGAGSWINLYRGIIYCLMGLNDEALKSFNRIEEPSWQLYYNKGIVQMITGLSEDAVASFNSAINELNQTGYLKMKNVYLSRIKTELAGIYLNMGKSEEGYRILDSAIELDNDNYRAVLMRRLPDNS